VDHRQERRSPFLLPSVAIFLTTKIHPVFNAAFDLSFHATVNSETEQEEYIEMTLEIMYEQTKG
jgi:hypothetical protein